MRALDTNVLVRLITRDDPQQAAAADTFIAKGAWVSVLALAETAWVLEIVYERSSLDIATAIDMLLHHRDLTLQDPDAVAAAVRLLRKRPTLGFSDCLMLKLARKSGHLPLGAFDRTLGKTEGALRL